MKWLEKVVAHAYLLPQCPSDRKVTGVEGAVDTFGGRNLFEQKVYKREVVERYRFAQNHLRIV